MEPAPLRILGIGGSTRQASRSRALLQAALRRAQEAGAQTVLADVRALALPLYDEDWPLERYPSTLPWFLEQVRAADGFVLGSPTYHGTLSGAVKNLLDLLEFLGDDEPPYFGGKPVGLLAVGGASAMNALNALHHSVRALNGLSVPTLVLASGSALDLERSEVTDPVVGRRMERMVAQLLDLAGRLRRPG